MNRRRFLAVATGGTALLAGCATDASEPADDGDGAAATPDENGTETANGGDETDRPDPAALAEELTEGRVLEFETAPLSAAVVDGRYSTVDDLHATFSATAPATAESPATVGAVLTNREDFERTVRLDRLPGFDDPSLGRTDDHEAIYLLPTENHELAAETPEVNRDRNGRWRVEGRVPDVFPETVTLGPEESVVGEYYVLGPRGTADPALEAGRYQFAYRGEGFAIAAWETDAPGPDGKSDLADADLPDLPDDGETRWFHDAEPSSTVSLEPSTESLEAPGAIDFALVNHSHESLSGNPYYWGLYKLVDGEWYRIEPWEWNDPLSFLEPGTVDESTLRLYHGGPVPCSDSRVVGHVGGGRYAYHVGYGRDGETHAAAFDLEAPAIDVEPEADLEVADDGDEVIVTTPAWGEEGHPPDATLTLEPVEGKADERVIPEQLYRRPQRGLRNALPFAEDGADRVVLRADRRVATDAVGYDADRRRFAYGDRVYEAVASIEN